MKLEKSKHPAHEYSIILDRDFYDTTKKPSSLFINNRKFNKPDGNVINQKIEDIIHDKAYRNT